MILRDLVFPTEIVGKRIRYLSDGSKIFKVYLEPKDRYCTENKLETYNAAFEKITGKKAVFLYPVE
jgi:small subunit ribosomal protein S7e